MSQTRAELDKSLTQLRTLRDEVRVQLHLAGMDAKEKWNKLEPMLDAVEHKAHEASEASRTAVADAVKTLKHFRDSLRGGPHEGHGKGAPGTSED